MQLTKQFVAGGKVVISNEPTILWTVLGSCVSVILHSKSHAFTAFSHAQLPEKSLSKASCSASCTSPCYREASADNSLKYVSCSIRYMADQLKKQGITRGNLDVYLFGGADMMGMSMKIGQKNVTMAQKLLATYRLIVGEEDVGGNLSRKIFFNSHSGKVNTSILKNPWPSTHL